MNEIVRLKALQAASLRVHARMMLMQVQFDGAHKRGNIPAMERIVEDIIRERANGIRIAREMAIVASKAVSGEGDAETRAAIADLQRIAGMRRPYKWPEA